MGQGPTVAGDAGELVEEFVFGLWGRFKISTNERFVDNEAMLVHHRLKGVNDAALFLGRVADFFDGDGMMFVKDGFEELCKHAIAKVIPFSININARQLTKETRY